MKDDRVFNNTLDQREPGQPIRYPVEQEGRRMPLERSTHLEYLLAPGFSPESGIGSQ